MYNRLREELNPRRKQSDLRIPALKLSEGLMDDGRDGICGWVVCMYTEGLAFESIPYESHSKHLMSIRVYATGWWFRLVYGALWYRVMIVAVLRHVETVARETEVVQAGVHSPWELAQNAVKACGLADFDSFSKDLLTSAVVTLKVRWPDGCMSLILEEET